MTEHIASGSERPRSAAARAIRSHRAIALVATGLIAAAGVLHLILVPEYLAEAPIIGILFLVSGPLTLGVAWRLWRHEDLAAWVVGTVVAGGMILGFVLSRTVGLLGYLSDNWAEGVPSLVVEVAFLVAAAVTIPRLLASRRGHAG